MPDATVVAPRLVFQFEISISGPSGTLAAALCHGVQLPKDSVMAVEHSAGGMTHVIKTAGGMESYEDIVLEKIQPVDAEDNWAYDWLKAACDPETMVIGFPEDYKRNVIIAELDGQGNVIPESTYEYEGCWVREVEYSKHDAMEKGTKKIETVRLAPDRRVD